MVLGAIALTAIIGFFDPSPISRMLLVALAVTALGLVAVAHRHTQKTSLRADQLPDATDTAAKMAARPITRRLIDKPDGPPNDGQQALQFIEDVIQVVRLPLNTILGFAEILQSHAIHDLTESERRTYHQLLLDSSRQLANFVADVGDMTRIDAHHFQLLDQEVDAAELTEIAMKFCREAAEEADAVVIVNVIDNIELRCDAARIRRVLVTLVTRAVAVSRPGATVNVSLIQHPDGGLDFTVSDQGDSLTAEEIALAFEPSLHARGLDGLSLPIARRIAHLHGGRLTFESALGGGMIARLTLPAVRLSWKAGTAPGSIRAA
jgi:signal transduction histidine kinase